MTGVCLQKRKSLGPDHQTERKEDRQKNTKKKKQGEGGKEGRKKKKRYKGKMDGNNKVIARTFLHKTYLTCEPAFLNSLAKLPCHTY